MFQLRNGNRQRKRRKSSNRRPAIGISLRSPRRLRHETLEDRCVLALLGVAPLGLPTIGYDTSGDVSYDATSDTFSLHANPTTITTSSATGFFFSGDFDINILVNGAGALAGNFPGNDLVLTGDVDTNGDFVPDVFAVNGPLLTAEVLAFGSLDSGGSTDTYDFRFQITGGQLAGLYTGKDLGVVTTSEISTFTGDFGVNFSGKAKGDIGAIPKLTPGIELRKLTNGIDVENHDDAPDILPGATVTWTYEVRNTGNVPFTKAEVVVIDDNGTPGNTADDFNPTLVAASDVGGDEILSPGETWIYTASADALDLGTGSSSTFNFEGNSNVNGTAGNIRTFTSGSLSVKTSAFSRSSSGVWSTAFLGSYSGGLGVTDGSENGSNNTHTVDNVGRNNYVLFEFSETVVVDAAFLGYVVGDSDLRIWIGTKTDPFNNHLTLSDALLNGFYSEVNETTLTTTRLADLNAGLRAGNVLVIAANTGEPKPNDFFKIKTVKVKDHACYENKAVVTVPGATDSDWSQYCNPSGEPCIDIEKYVNGYDADSKSTAVQIAAGDTVTWTYKVKNTGEVPFTKSQVVVTDDNGTPNDTSDDFNPTWNPLSDVGGDEILSPGETWTYTYSTEALDVTTLGASSTFKFEGNTAQSGTAGNIMTFTSGGTSVKVSAFSRDKSTGIWAKAYLGNYSNGLGVTDSSEGSGGNNGHAVDNNGRDNYLLFEFNNQIVVDSAFLGYVVGDSDLTVWIGSKTDPFNNHLSLSDSVLESLGFTEVNETTLTTARWADFNAGNLAGNVLVIAAKTGGDSLDVFKLNKLIFRQLEPGYYKNVAKVKAVTVSDSDVGYYKNPDCVEIDFKFAGNSSNTGTKGNIHTFTVDNVSVNASAFSRTKGDVGTWDTAYLGVYSDGLGVTDKSEDGKNGSHRNDNIGRLNYILFEFSTIIEVDRAFLDSVVGDSDITLWIGTVNNPFHNHLTLNESTLWSLGYVELNDANNGNARWADINPDGVKGNVLVIAASDFDPSSNDQFKISKLEVCAEAVKFYTVDTTSDNTYEYGPTGQNLANYKINKLNSNPRGIATTAAGNKVWVVDGNKTVYVYDVDGKLLGSWVANGLTTPEDITTNGTDIWIVDDGSNKVFRFAGAASRTSGSQNATSSFVLNGANSDAKGIVTNGTHLWVVNDGTIDKVFKYNLSGTLQGSWTIDSNNGSPTGITIDPANVNHIWIVDSADAAVYRYNGAAGHTAGSHTASSVFQLASGNTNAQGIADPPPRASAGNVLELASLAASSSAATQTSLSSQRLSVAMPVKDQAIAEWMPSTMSRSSTKEHSGGAAPVQERYVSSPSSLLLTARLVSSLDSNSRRGRLVEWLNTTATDSTFDAFDPTALHDDTLDYLAEEHIFKAVAG